MDKERIDFGVLDPSRDELKWERMISSVVDRAVTAREEAAAEEESNVLGQLLAWARPVLAIAAVLAVIIWGVALFAGSLSTDDGIGGSSEPAYELAAWASNDEVPQVAEILNVLGERHGTR